MMIILNWLKKHWQAIVVIGLVVVLLMCLRECHDRGRELETVEQNYYALQDSTRMVRNKAGELEAERLVLLADRDRLAALDKELSAELEKERGKVKVITKTDMVIKYVPVTVPTDVTKTNDSTYVMSWRADRADSGWYRKLAGQTSVTSRGDTLYNANTTITEDEMGLTLYSGLREKDGKWEIFARTANPNVKLDIKGAVIDPETSGLIDRFKQKEPVLKGGVIGGVAYDENGQFEYEAGIAAQVRIGPIDIGPYAIMTFSPGELNPSVGARIQYNLIKW